MPKNCKQKETTPERWYVLTVKPRHELVVAAGLQSKGVENYLPTYVVRRRWSDRTKRLTLPLFPGYVFCRISLSGGVQVLPTPGVRTFVTFGGGPEPVPDDEMAPIIRITSSGLPLEPLAYLCRGDRVRVREGPLRGIEGTLWRCGDGMRVVVGIEMLQRSVSVAIDRAALEPLTDTVARVCRVMPAISSRHETGHSISG